jgi:hypothetical protein
MPWASLVLTLPSVPTDTPGKRASPRRTQQVGCLGLWPGEHHKRRLGLRLLIEEKVRQTPESFLDRGKGSPDARGFSVSRKCQSDARPEPRGFFFIVEKKPYQDQSAGGARKRHVFCAVCPYRPAGQDRKSKTKLLSFLPF